MAATTRRSYAPRKTQEQPFYSIGGPALLADTDPNPKFKKPSAQEQKDWGQLYQHLESRRAALYTWRLQWWQTWGQIALYQKPERYYFYTATANTQDRGRRRDQAIVDRTATIAG